MLLTLFLSYALKSLFELKRQTGNVIKMNGFGACFEREANSEKTAMRFQQGLCASTSIHFYWIILCFYYNPYNWFWLSITCKLPESTAVYSYIHLTYRAAHDWGTWDNRRVTCWALHGQKARWLLQDVIKTIKNLSLTVLRMVPGLLVGENATSLWVQIVIHWFHMK